MKNNLKQQFCPTITVGISAYNESSTILQLIASLIQQQGSFILEKILIYSDGSTDDTPKKIGMLAKLYPTISAVIDSNNRGKAYRLNQVFQSNTSDIAIIIDADILIIDKLFIDKLSRPFIDESVGIVSSNNQYLSNGNFLSTIVATSEELWYRARENYNDGDNFYNNSGSAVAFNASFVKKVKLPTDYVDDQHYLYYLCVRDGFSFKFSRTALSFCVAPGTIRDIIMNQQRSNRESIYDELFSQTLGHRIDIAKSKKINALIYMLYHRPLMTCLALVYLVMMRFSFISVDPMTKNGLWFRLASTKKAFTPSQLSEAISISHNIS